MNQTRRRPEPFSVYTTPDFWNDPHISERMLCHHLDPTTYFSSRPVDFIDRSVEWIVEEFSVRTGTRVLDLGCGPGLYALRLARRGARVTGVDVSRRSLEHARKEAVREGLDIEYLEGSYLERDLPQGVDLTLMIYRDYCALSPDQRRILLHRIARSLRPGGALVFDVQAASGFEDREESSITEENLHDGFFSEKPYTGTEDVFLYPDERLVLERYTIVESGRTRQFFNWNQYLMPHEVAEEIEEAGLRLDKVLGDVAGSEFDETTAWEFAVVARKS